LPGDGPRVTPPDDGARYTGAAARIPIRRPLIVGYGNPLRGDDGLGPLAAALLADDPRLRGARVLQRHQLTPELAFDASGASLLVLVDAAADRPAGEVTVRRLDACAVAGEVMTHHLDPAGLVGLARELWGTAPPVVLVSVGVSSLELGDTLTADVEEAIPRAVDAVAGIIEEHGHA
jgi:hydrogenase maturation protease